MKQCLFIFLIFSSSSAYAQNKFWLTNKIEIGYNNIYVSESITIEDRTFSKNAVAVGLIFKLADSIKYKNFYIFENSIRSKWMPIHFFGGCLTFKLK